MSPTKTEGSQSSILEMLMRPLVRYCLRNALSFQDFINSAKLVFVSVAEEEIRKSTQKVNVSRLSVMTGLYRRDVTKIFREHEAPALQQQSILARILAQWEQDKQFCSKPGSPRPLTISGEDSEFRKLVCAVSGHVNAGTILFELERLGAIKKVGDQVRLQSVYNRFDGDKSAGFKILADDLELIIQAAEENIVQRKPIRNLHLRTSFDNIYASDVPTIRRWFIDQGKLFHKRARDFLSQFDKDVNPRPNDEQAGVKVELGAYSFTSIFPDEVEEGGDEPVSKKKVA
ncbi:MAG: hypothetical protein J0M12_05820 [Deltaproteobacteria bacterium]|nr:hypothetical protein [Deltaproteobacteria bacterium]